MGDFRTHYAIFWTDSGGRQLWARSAVKREAIKAGRLARGTVYQVNHDRDRAWDAPTFRSVGDCIGDFRETSADVRRVSA